MARHTPRIPEALQSLRPGAEWTLVGNTYAGLNWTDGVQTKPTEAEVTAEVDRLIAEGVTNQQRLTTIQTDQRLLELQNELRTRNNTQIESFIRNFINVDSVTDFASAKQAMKRMETAHVNLALQIALLLR